MICLENVQVYFQISVTDSQQNKYLKHIFEKRFGYKMFLFLPGIQINET